MRAALSLLLIASFALSGCDKVKQLTGGGPDQKTLDASAIGYACRVALKGPEDCMKENESFSQTALLDGWKAADRDINGGILDPSMGKDPNFVHAVPVPASAVSASGVAASGVNAASATSAAPKPAVH
jgi:hypothetical protein